MLDQNPQEAPMEIFDYLRIDKPMEQLESSYFSILSQMIQDCEGGTKSDLGAFSQFLVKVVHDQLRAVSPEVRSAIIGMENASPELRQAYVMGQLSLAQSVISSMFSRRADDTFVPTLLQRKYRDILKHLLAKDMTGVDLARLTNSTPETISRKLRLLREMGAADFRKDGTHTVNFLTHVAKAVLTDNGVTKKKLRADS
jgi:DNA-binding transcriptional ArsR family regulator